MPLYRLVPLVVAYTKSPIQQRERIVRRLGLVVATVVLVPMWSRVIFRRAGLLGRTWACGVLRDSSSSCAAAAVGHALLIYLRATPCLKNHGGVLRRHWCILYSAAQQATTLFVTRQQVASHSLTLACT